MKTIITFIIKFLLSIPLLSLLIQFQDVANGQTINQDTGAELDRFFTETVEAQKYVGLGACLIKDNKIIWDGCYGYSDLEKRIFLSRENIFQLASLSKTVTATALMQLFEKGLFKLDDDINNYMPIKVRNPNFLDKPITFRMLLTHTSGLEDVMSTGLKIPKDAKYPRGTPGDPIIPLAKLVEELFTLGGEYYSVEYFSKTEPGSKYSYSNFAFSLIGYLVEKISKEDFSEYCKKNIFHPLGMNNTGWFLRDLDTNKVVYGYGFPVNDSVPVYKKIKHFGEPGYPAGNLRTTINDFAIFISAFINKGSYNGYRLLKPETARLMLTPQGVKNIPSRSFPISDIGLTWLEMDIDGEKLFSMNGFSGAIFTSAFFSQEKKIGIIYFYTGIIMKNMPAMIEITNRLFKTLKSNG